ncbi:hypothetical protein [Rhodococcus wratislaviensis]|uniref:hypothetical protein n=1 Tax=Rhodococcus wratislaviensis TaxID=44752 RepID=UPI00364C224B
MRTPHPGLVLHVVAPTGAGGSVPHTVAWVITIARMDPGVDALGCPGSGPRY